MLALGVQIIVIPLTITQIDWGSVQSELLLTPIQDLSGYIRMLDRFESGILPNKILHLHDSNLLNALSIGFLVKAPKEGIIELKNFGIKLPIIGKEGDSAVWTQTVREWRETLLRDTTRSDFITLLILNKIFMFFEQAGLRNVWWGYAKEDSGKGFGTFNLRPI